MRYIRTKDGHLFPLQNTKIKDYIYEENGEFKSSRIIKRADNIEDLCDTFVAVCKNILHPRTPYHFVEDEYYEACRIREVDTKDHTLYGAVWCDKGLIYVAKMNEKGELELL